MQTKATVLYYPISIIIVIIITVVNYTYLTAMSNLVSRHR